MNEFTIKKLAEVEAFCRLSSATLNRSTTDFTESQTSSAAILQSISKISITLKDEEKLGLFNDKVDKTVSKLTSMMELYIGDEWNNPVEILEWLSFYSGAAAAHATLALNAVDNGMHKSQLQKAIDTFDLLLIQVKSALSDIGHARSKILS